MCKRFINRGFIPGVKDSTFYSTFQRCHENKELEARIHYDTSPMPKARGNPETAQSFAVMACVCARVHKKSLQKSLMSLKLWIGGQLKQQWIGPFPHTVNHKSLRWGLQKKACTDHIPPQPLVFL